MIRTIIVTEAPLPEEARPDKKVNVYIDRETALRLENEGWKIYWPECGEPAARPYVQLTFPMSDKVFNRLLDAALDSAAGQLSTI